jgi:transcriptional regulator with XRE-family HTH domain
MQAEAHFETARTVTALTDMAFPERLVTLRKARGMTQQALADAAGIHVSQIRRYETNVAQPSVDALVKLARGLATSTDALLFDDSERGPQDDLRLPFEAAERLDPHERQLVRELLDALLLRHQVKDWSAAKG